MLVLAAQSGDYKEGSSAIGAVEAFATLLLMSYASFVAFTYAFKDTLLPPPMSSQDHEQGLPPAQAGQFAADGAGGYGGSGYAGGASAAYADEGAPAGAPSSVL